MDKRTKDLMDKMAEGFGSLPSSDSDKVRVERTQSLIDECRHMEESCLHMAITISEWVKSLKSWRAAFVIFPIIFSSYAAWLLFSKQPDLEWLAGICALLAGLAPAVYKGLDFDINLDVLGKQVQQFKTLQDRFRQARNITALSSPDAFQSEFDTLMEDLAVVRLDICIPPERFYKKAQIMISERYYNIGDDELEKTNES